jgi:pilin/secretion family protein with methylation motif
MLPQCAAPRARCAGLATIVRIVSRSRGFSLVETLVGLLILTFIVTTSLLIVFERERRLKFAAETVAAYQALANEVEVQRRVPFEELLPGETDHFYSDTAIVGDFPDLQKRVLVEEIVPGIKNVTFTLRWGTNQRTASISMTRSSTGGSNLW